jgi:hypothetical protein
MPQMTGMQGMPQMTGMQGMSQMQGMPQMTGLEGMSSGRNLEGAYSPTNLNMDAYSPVMNGNDVGMNITNPNQVEGLNQIPLHMRNDVLSSLNNIQMPQNQMPQNQNMNYSKLPTMQEIQNNGLGNLMQQNLPMQMNMPMQSQQPTMNQNAAQNILSQLPEGYSGSIPLELANNLPMIGGGKKKKKP